MTETPLDGSTPPGLLVVISGPSGAGKTTIVHEVRERLDAVFSVSATTRPSSANEQDGIDYFFLDDERFRAMIAEGEFLEYAHVFDRHWYGTPRRAVEEALAAGRVIILDIDVKGALQVRRSMPDAYMMFVLPPSEEELLRRLRTRAREDEDAIQRRFGEATREIRTARSSGAYDTFIVNDDLERAQDEACAHIRRRLSRARSGCGERGQTI